MTLPFTKHKWFKPVAAAALLLGGVIVGAAIMHHPKSAPSPASQSTKTADQQDNPGSDNPLDGAHLYVDPHSNAAQQAAQWRTTHPDDAALMFKLAAQPTSKWLTADASLDEDLAQYLSAAKATDTTPTLVVYNIPGRDCGLYSAGGSATLGAYQKFIDSLSAMVGSQKAIFIIEPDALAAIENNDAQGKPCVGGKQLTERYQALSYAAEHLGKLPASTVYLDAGHSAWVSSLDKLAERLQKAGIDLADGFSLNVSNFQTLEDSLSYGKDVSARLNGAHFVVDTSRNGAGPYKNPKYSEYNWCNPPDRALGHYPTTQTGQSLADAYLYIKSPGESDGYDPNPGKCQGGPRAGEWWPDYALGLIKRWPAALQPPATR